MKALKLRSAFKCIQVIVHEYCQMVWKNLFYRIIRRKSASCLHCDFIFSAGRACRSAEMLKYLGMRQMSCPCDWMTNYSLKTYGQLIFSRTFSLFNTWMELPSNHHFRVVQDMETGMISSHDFLKTSSVDEGMALFHSKMSRRTSALCDRLEKGKNIGCVMNREEDDDSIRNFCMVLSKKFPHATFKVLNIKSSPGMQGINKRTVFESNNVSLYEYTFDDTPANNPEWLGNRDMWLKLILSEFHVKRWKRHLYPWNFPLLNELLSSVRHQNIDF